MKKENKEDFIKSIFHIFVIAPILIFIGIYQPSNMVFYYLLLFFGVVIIARFIMNWMNKSLYTLLYLHALLIAPILIYVFYLHYRKYKNSKETSEEIPKIFYYLLINIGISATIYHSYKLISSFNLSTLRSP
jgi:hypothetical protein